MEIPNNGVYLGVVFKIVICGVQRNILVKTAFKVEGADGDTGGRDTLKEEVGYNSQRLEIISTSSSAYKYHGRYEIHRD